MTGELTLALASQLLQTVYLPKVRSTMNDEMSPAYKQVESKKTHVVGQTATFNVHVDRSAGTGARAEMDTLPEADRQKTQQGSVTLKFLYGRMKITGQTMILANKSPATFVDATSFEMQRLQEDLTFDCSRQFWNDSNAFIAQASGVPTGQVVPFANITDAQWRQVIVGMTVDFGTSANGTAHASAVVVASYDKSAKTITFTGTVSSVIANSYMRKTNTYTSVTKERTGLPTIVNSGDTLHNISGVTYARWNSYVNSNSGTLRAPTELLLERVVDEIGMEAGKVPNFGVGPHDVVRNYGAQLQSQKRYNDSTQLKGGVSGLTITSGEATVGLVADRFAPANAIWFANSDHLTFHEAEDWTWMNEDGAILSRIANVHAYEATIFKFSELATDRRNAHGVVRDVAGS